MAHQRQEPRRREEGFALLTATIFAFIVIIVGAGVFAMASYETRQALYREHSSEAFYLADGGIERARAKFLDDRTWRDGWSDAALGQGTYDVTVRDTTYAGRPKVVKVISTGHVEVANRAIEVLAEVPPTGLGEVMLVMGDADVGGNMCLDGLVHVNGDGYFGPNDGHLSCDTEYTEGFYITPPPIYVDPAHYPNALYYYIQPVTIPGPPVKYSAKIYDRNKVDVTAALGDPFTGTGIVSHHPINGYTFTFQTADLVLLCDPSRPFAKPAGKDAVVLNFAEFADQPSLVFAADYDLHATVINTKFLGVTVEDRLDWNFWSGKLTTVQRIKWEPDNGIAVIAHDFERSGGALVEMGTTDRPALVYVTRDAISVNANWQLVGTIICLRNWSSQGGITLVYDPDLLEILPDFFEDWAQGVSGSMKILRWRETASLN
ncbi:MAG: pilus assembly PilX N-terminal domain-containing protein [Candidatus Eisenbacteria bacterium]